MFQRIFYSYSWVYCTENAIQGSWTETVQKEDGPALQWFVLTMVHLFKL
jgi:hypothetical protein